MKSQFEKWFEAQFGKRSTLFLRIPDKELKDLVERGKAAELELIRRGKYDSMKLAASYARNAAKNNFDF